MIKAVLFDFDGLILDTEYPEYQAWCTVYDSYGCSIPMEKWILNIGRGTALFDPYEDLATQYNKPIDTNVVRATKRAHFTELMREQPLLPGIELLLNEAREAGILCALVSSSPRDWIMRFLPTYGIESHFHCLCTGDEVANTKPDPDLYLLALERLNLASEEVIALEDSPNGVRAAQKAGIFCIAVPNRITHHTPLDHANHILPSLEGITLEYLHKCK